MVEEAKKTFKGYELTAQKGGYKGKREVMGGIFKEEGVTPEVVDKVFGVLRKTQHEMADFCKTEVIDNKLKSCEMSLPVTSGFSIEAGVSMRKTYQTMVKKDDDGNIIEPSKPIHKFGVTTMGMSFSVTKNDKEHLANIRSEVESACSDFCKKQDEEAAKEAK